MIPAELSKKARSFSRKLNIKDSLLMSWRPRICPFHILMNHIPEGSSVLDVGCGAGLWLLLLSGFGRISKGLGVEVSRRKVEIANSIKSAHDYLEFVKIGPDDLWPKGDYDCITMIDILHHIPLKNQKDFLARINETNAKKIVFKDIDPKAKIKSFMNSIHDLLLSRQLPKYCEKEKVAGWLEEIGFKVIYLGRHDMLWYSHYLIVAERK